ncbi:MAG: hypothetical protein ACLR8P_16750 [Clostridium fessum]
MAKAAEAGGGADVLSLINTLTGMKIDINRGAFAVANRTGGLSGPAVKPVAVRMVYQVAQAVKPADHRHGRYHECETMRSNLFWRAQARWQSVRRISIIPYATEEIREGHRSLHGKKMALKIYMN